MTPERIEREREKFEAWMSERQYCQVRKNKRLGLMISWILLQLFGLRRIAFTG